MSDLFFNKESDYSEENIYVTVKSFAPSLFNHFSMSLNRKKRVIMRAMRKKLNIFTIQLPICYLLYCRINNLDLCKCGHCKNKTREIYYLSCIAAFHTRETGN